MTINKAQNNEQSVMMCDEKSQKVKNETVFNI
jgi:hypothetical protein